MKVTDNKVAFKSGYDKYLRVDTKDGVVRGISDAVGPMEQWEPIFQVTCILQLESPSAVQKSHFRMHVLFGTLFTTDWLRFYRMGNWPFWEPTTVFSVWTRTASPSSAIK